MSCIWAYSVRISMLPHTDALWVSKPHKQQNQRLFRFWLCVNLNSWLAYFTYLMGTYSCWILFLLYCCRFHYMCYLIAVYASKEDILGELIVSHVFYLQVIPLLLRFLYFLALSFSIQPGFHWVLEFDYFPLYYSSLKNDLLQIQCPLFRLINSNFSEVNLLFCDNIV